MMKSLLQREAKTMNEVHVRRYYGRLVASHGKKWGMKRCIERV
jgi:hypothetical protein